MHQKEHALVLPCLENMIPFDVAMLTELKQKTLQDNPVLTSWYTWVNTDSENCVARMRA